MRKRIPFIAIVLLFLTNTTAAQLGSKYYALVGGAHSGYIPSGQLVAQQGVAGYRYINGNHWESLLVDSFRVTILRDSILIFSYQNKSNIFEPPVIMKFKNLVAGDRVFVHEIHSSWPGLPDIFLQPLEYIMK